MSFMSKNVLFIQIIHFKQIKKSFTIFCLHFQSCFYIIENEGDLRIMNVAQYPEQVHKTKMLSNNHPSCRTPYQYCCKTNPSQDDFEVYYDEKM